MNADKIRQDFPLLNQKNPPVYLDSACQSLRPRQVIDAVTRYYTEHPTCSGRSYYRLAERTQNAVRDARHTVANFINAKCDDEIAFTLNTTNAINLAANSIGLKEGEIVLISDKEHNSNLLPWQLLSKRNGVRHDTFRFGDIEDFRSKINKNVKLVSLVHVSNLDGTSNPVKEMIRIAHEHGALVVVDGAQSVPHRRIDVRKLDIDVLACSGHKMLGPSGTGFLYAKYKLLEEMHPFIVGGDTVDDSTYTTAEFKKPPEKFEAGLQDYAGIIGLAEAVRYLTGIGMENIEKHENVLNRAVTESVMGKLGEKITLLGPAEPEKRAGIFSFNVKNLDVHTAAMMLDRSANIMVRSGAHCCHSWFNANRIQGSVRASLYLYNTEEECRRFAEALKRICSL